jgi:hypothetical protein
MKYVSNLRRTFFVKKLNERIKVSVCGLYGQLFEDECASLAMDSFKLYLLKFKTELEVLARRTHLNLEGMRLMNCSPDVS